MTRLEPNLGSNTDRMRALGEVASATSPRVVELMVRLLGEDECASVRLRAAEVLGDALAAGSAMRHEYFEPAETMLIGRLRDSDAAVRRACAQALGRMYSEKSMPHLVRLLRDRKVLVRFRAAEALESIGDVSAIGALRSASQSTWNPYLRRVLRGVVESLEEIKGPTVDNDRS